jgi:hypothetical protein
MQKCIKSSNQLMTPPLPIRPRFLTALLALLTLTVHGASDEVRFNRDILPILSDNCFKCHGPDPKQRKGKMRLDDRAAALAKEAFVPGDTKRSELIYRINADDPEDFMPPAESHKKLTDRQKDLLTRWIAQGATYEPHWSYTPIVRPAVPAASAKDWPTTPIDDFILERLEAAKIQPSPEADRRTLLRRLALDLTGLPPTPAEVDAFERDRSPQAYQKQVDRLLASPHYGERMAVPWLDAVRYADTVGYHGDQDQNVFPYRDYVIDSFNHNKRFDRFTIEQIAGDLLPNATPEQRVASGFNRLNMMTREGGAQPREYLVKYSGDRVRTVSTTWLGSTMACCECHDHKFDPFSQRDFYSMAAFFDDIKQWGVYSDYTYTPNPDLKGWDNDHPFPPEILVTNAYLLRREATLQQRIADLAAAQANALKTDATARADYAKWLEHSRDFLRTWTDGWQVALYPTVRMADTNSPAKLEVKPDGSVLVTGKPKGNDKVIATFGLQKGRVAGLRLELLQTEVHGGSPFRGGHKQGEIKLAATLRKKDGKTVNASFYDAQASDLRPTYFNGHEKTGVAGQWRTSDDPTNQTACYLPSPPLLAEEGDLLEVRIESDDIGCFRLSVTPFANDDALESGGSAELASALNRSAWFRSADQRALLAKTYLLGTAYDRPAYDALKQLRLDVLDCRNGTAHSLISQATTNLFVTHVLPRGNWQDESGPIVNPATPHFLPGPKQPAEGRLSRLDLGNWLVSRENPLTARAFVNRLWKQFYGSGFSNQPEELGAQGEPPTHPDLLDWLAAEFIESGWDVKHIVRLMVTSTAYRQGSKVRPELVDEDPNNRMVARQNARRLEAEFVRDNALSIAGLLNPEIGGPSAFPYQPAGYYANIQFPDRDYPTSHGDLLYRRGLYTHWQRAFLHPMMANFDAPAREECAVDRTVSNTPQQALTLLNDPAFVEAARVFAANLLENRALKTDPARLDAAFEKALLRPIKDRERPSLLALLEAQRGYYRENPEEAAKLIKVGDSPTPTDVPPAEQAAWTSVTRVILNLGETITRY